MFSSSWLFNSCHSIHWLEGGFCVHVRTLSSHRCLPIFFVDSHGTDLLLWQVQTYFPHKTNMCQLTFILKILSHGNFSSCLTVLRKVAGLSPDSIKLFFYKIPTCMQHPCTCVLSIISLCYTSNIHVYFFSWPNSDSFPGIYFVIEGLRVKLVKEAITSQLTLLHVIHDPPSQVSKVIFSH